MQLQDFGRYTPAVWEQTPLDAWSDELRLACGRYHPHGLAGVDLVTGGVSPFDAAGLEIVQVATDVDVVRRAERDIRLDYSENVFLLMQLEGACGVEQRGRESLIEPGDCILVDSSLPSNFYFKGRFSNHLSVHLPRKLLLADRFDFVDVARRLSADDPMSTMLRALIAKMLQTPADHVRAVELRGLFLHAVRQAFACEAPEGSFCPRDRASGRLELARALIDRYLTDPKLSAQWLAARLGVSMRTLQEDFSAAGDTVTGFIRERRLRLARARLTEMRGRPRGGAIADIAYASGFNDISYFNRCFRKAFDCSPRDVTRV